MTHESFGDPTKAGMTVASEKLATDVTTTDAQKGLSTLTGRTSIGTGY